MSYRNPTSYIFRSRSPVSLRSSWDFVDRAFSDHEIRAFQHRYHVLVATRLALRVLAPALSRGAR